MDIFEAIKNRRSIRKFKADLIPEELLMKIIDAGNWAPSEGNLQPWIFYLIENKLIKKSLVEAALSQEFIYQAPIVLVIGANLEASFPYGRRGKELFCLQSTAAAIQNIMLVAYSLGIGSCLVGAFNEEEVSRILELPGKIRPVAIIPLGYPAEAGKTRRDDISHKLKRVK